MQDMALDGNASWRAQLCDESGQSFDVFFKDEQVAQVNWSLLGRFNVENGLAAIAASAQAGVLPSIAAEALKGFQPVKRRLEVKTECRGITVYDDFAHHPTAIEKTIEALAKSKRHQRILVVLEFASFTMRSGLHAHRMAQALSQVDHAFILNPTQFNLSNLTQHWTCPYQILPTCNEIVSQLISQAQTGDAILVMSNRGFDNIHQHIAQALVNG